MGFQAAFPLMLGWEVLIDQPKSGTFFHCDCPWGGELLKIRVEVSVSRELGSLGELGGVSDPIYVACGHPPSNSGPPGAYDYLCIYVFKGIPIILYLPPLLGGTQPYLPNYFILFQLG